MALLRVAPAVQKLHDSLTGDEKVGAAIILRSLEEPIRHIAANSGHDGGVIADEVKSREGSMGFDANSGEFDPATPHHYYNRTAGIVRVLSVVVQDFTT